MDFEQAQKDLCRKLDIDFTMIAYNGLFTLTDIKGYINDAGREAWDLHFWDFAEHIKTATLISANVTNGYVPYPYDYAPASLYLLTINGEEHSKKRFQDFRRYFEEDATAEDKFWAEHKRKIYLNTNIIAVGDTIDLYGKKVYSLLSANSDLLPFSPELATDDQSANQAVITLAYSHALSSEKKKNPSQALVEQKKAYAILDTLWKAQNDGQSIEQPKNRPMFEVRDMFAPQSNGSASIGTFSQ